MHTHFVRFPIDVVFLDRHSHVIRIVPQLRPWRGAVARKADAVLELPAGASERAGLRIGTPLAWGRIAEAAA